MDNLGFDERVQILAMGAKFDVSCVSSGGNTKAKKGQLGDCVSAGICHSFAADGRCISLLKILQSNKCEFDCLYCTNRKSNDIKRASLTSRELADLTISFYKRNYIEGLFLSSAVEKSPNATMEKLIETLRILRHEYGFRGYVHLKAIPGADQALIELASSLADRMSVNIELPSEPSLKLLAPQKKIELITSPMRQLSSIYSEGLAEKRRAKLPAGQSTQMIIGATPDSDGQIIRLTQALYDKFKLKRVFFSAYIPVNDNSNLPSLPPNLLREHRLYEADWLMRFYGFKAEEITEVGQNLSLDVDPKSDWALRNIGRFPIEINTAEYEMLLRVPGIGVKNAYRIAEAQRFGKISFEALKKMRVALNRAKHFITVDGKFYGSKLEPEYIRLSLTDRIPRVNESTQTFSQISMFDRLNAITGEL